MGSSVSPADNYNIDSEDILRRINDSEKETEKQNYELWVNSVIEDLLGRFNNRDTQAIQTHLLNILKALSSEVKGTIKTIFGGSVSKHTHINGLSDVDTLVILNDSSLSSKSPKEVLQYFFEILKNRLPNTNIKIGDTSVTVQYRDGDVQLVPAIRFKTGLKIPDKDEWSRIIQPTRFARQLTVTNAQMNGSLIPSIKIIKGIVAGFASRSQLKGYHLEALALEIFKSRPIQSFKVKDIITEFFKHAPKLVRQPMKDVTGQTEHIDHYLGKKDSIDRLIAADALERTYRQIELANAASMKSTWVDLLAHV